MSGISVVSDTNPLIYLMDGTHHFTETSASLLDKKHVWISVITELELFGKKGSKEWGNKSNRFTT